MALIRCPECSKEISDKAEACPYCGFPISEHSLENLINSSENYTGIGFSDILQGFPLNINIMDY